MAKTGRSSTSILKPPVRPEKLGFAFQILTRSGIGEEIRSLYIPEPGFIFLDADLSQVEARICALLSEDYETLKLFDTTDIHKYTYRLIFNKKEEEPVDDPQRYLGKTLRYAIQYGSGEERLMFTINSDAKRYNIPIQVSRREAREFLNLAHSKMPKIKSIFHRGIEQALLNNNKTLLSPILPFGPAVGRRRQFFDRWGNDMFRQAYAQIPQSIPPDHIRRAYIFSIKPALIRMKELFSLRICGENHDALLFKCRIGFEETAKKLLKNTLETPIDFSSCSLPRGEIVIPVEVKVGPNYKEMKKI